MQQEANIDAYNTVSDDKVKKILIISGEESGDLHGSTLIDALKETLPGVKIMGMGGDRMRRSGLIGIDSKEISVIGIVEVIKKLPEIRSAFNALKEMIKKDSFDCAVLIDYPDFNLRFAKFVKEQHIPIVYYISPTIWAWRKGRIKTIARLVSKMLVVYPFEEILYKEAGVDVEYVGNPLLSTIKCTQTKSEAREALGIDKDKRVITLLPGSRTEEVRRLLPTMLRSVKLLQETLNEEFTVIVAAANSIDNSLINELSQGEHIKPLVVRDSSQTARRASDVSIVKSGTSTLETAMLDVPMVIIYKVSLPSYVIGKLLIGIKNIGLPNIIAGKRIVPELLQHNANPRKITDELKKILTDDKVRDEMLSGLKEVQAKLKLRDAPKRAASAIKELMYG